jgi:hypothetical protein
MIMDPKPASSRWLRSFRLRLALRPQGVDSTAWVIIMIDINTGNCALSMTCVDEHIVTVGLKCRCVICVSSHKSLYLSSYMFIQNPALIQCTPVPCLSPMA